MTEEQFSGPFVITGLSGSGKSVLSRSLEDLGYLCVDNIPLELVPRLFETSDIDLERLVVVVDVRRWPRPAAKIRRSCPRPWTRLVRLSRRSWRANA